MTTVREYGFRVRHCVAPRNDRSLCSAAEFSSRYCHHRGHRHRFSGWARHLQLPHCKHPRCNRTDRHLLCGDNGFVFNGSFFFLGTFFVEQSVLLPPGEGRHALGAVFLHVRQHKILARQQAVAFAELFGRRILGRQFAFRRPRAITLCRRYVISHRLPAQVETAGPCSAERRWVKAACG